MTTHLVLSVDAMGGDHGPVVVVDGVARGHRRLNGAIKGRELHYLLHGDEARIAREVARYPELQGRVVIRHTDQAIAMEDKPAQAIRRRGTSLWNALQSVKAGEAIACVSAGNTGALMALSRMILKMASESLERPAIVARWPTFKGVSAVLDVGANIASDAGQLLEFAIMGAAFQRALTGNPNPSIGILNVGSEEMKGHDEVREAHRLLREGDFGLNYHGFVEGNDIFTGVVDVVVTDGFTGNIALKTAEGTAKFVRGLLKDALGSTLRTKLGAFLAMPGLKQMAERIDPSTVNGGPLLGLNGIVVKSHGGADANSYSGAIVVAAELGAADVAKEIAADIQKLSSALKPAAVQGAEA